MHTGIVHTCVKCGLKAAYRLRTNTKCRLNVEPMTRACRHESRKCQILHDWVRNKTSPSGTHSPVLVLQTWPTGQSISRIQAEQHRKENWKFFRIMKKCLSSIAGWPNLMSASTTNSTFFIMLLVKWWLNQSSDDSKVITTHIWLYPKGSCGLEMARGKQEWLSYYH